MTSKEIISLLYDIIQKELSLPEDRVQIYGQNFKAPNDEGLYVTLGLESLKLMSSNRHKEIVSTRVAGIFSIDLTSQGSEALERNIEAVAAFRSFYSTQVQEKNHISISNPTQVSDLSFVEGPSSLNRFHFSVTVFYGDTFEKPIDSYDKIQSPEVV